MLILRRKLWEKKSGGQSVIKWEHKVSFQCHLNFLTIAREIMKIHKYKHTQILINISSNSFDAFQIKLVHVRGQREFSIPGILDESQLHFFSLDHEKWFSEVSISSRNMRVTKWNLILVSKYENGHMIISISSRQARARKIILNLVSKNCTFSRES